MAAAAAAAAAESDASDASEHSRHPEAERAAAASGSGCAPDDDHRVYLVPYRWWREAQEAIGECGVRGIPYSAAPLPSSYGMKIINMFNSDLVFSLRRAEDLLGVSEDSVRGRRYALIAADLWLQAFKWHIDANLLRKNSEYLSYAEDGSALIYPLTLRISVLRETNTLTLKISKKDNSADNYRRANKILNIESEPVNIWDFSGQTNLILMNEWNRLPQESRQADQEMFLEVQVFGLSEPLTAAVDGKKDDPALGSVLSNGNMEVDSDSGSGIMKRVGSGLTGLENLGNTCFMNSAVQCLAHTPKLVEHFLGDYKKQINRTNPLGMRGEIALAFGDLLRRLWSLDNAAVAPRQFKAKLALFAPQFGGFNQHDSQEFLAFLLDGLHEDLNRVKLKPYFEAKDSDGRPDEVVADEYWGNHLARNDSVIVDTCQGQYKSTLVCPVCSKVSITFDPFMYLSLPLPATTKRTMTITVFSTDGCSLPSSVTISVPKSGDTKKLIDELSTACQLKEDEYLLVAEVFNNRIIRYLEEPSDSISLIRDGDRLVAYQLPKNNQAPVLVFVHHCLDNNLFGRVTSRWKPFGVPLITSLPDTVVGASISIQFQKVINPFHKIKFRLSDGDQDSISGSGNEVDDVNVQAEPVFEDSNDSAQEDRTISEDAMQFYLTDARCQDQLSKIEMDQPITVTSSQKRLNVIVCWQDKAIEQYNFSSLNSLPEVYKSGFFTKRPQDNVTLYSCLEAFLKEEPLGPDDKWYCPECKEHQQALKKLDLWRLPEVLIIHLKRFSYSRYMKNKLETFVDFPIHNLDLSNYIRNNSSPASHQYRLYAISNHYGNMGGGHYTAYVNLNGENQWYDFDDRRVRPVSEDSIKTSAAYVLFYRRVVHNVMGTETSAAVTEAAPSQMTDKDAAMDDLPADMDVDSGEVVEAQPDATQVLSNGDFEDTVN